MYNYNPIDQLKPEEVLMYLRKSRADDPLLSVSEVLQKHETILNEWVERNLSSPIDESNRFREVVSGETIADRPEIQKVLKLIESPKIKAVLAVEVQRLSRGDLEDAGRLIKLLRYTNTLVITPQKIYDLRDEYDRDAFERELKRGNEFLEYQKKIMNRGTLLSVSQGNFVGNTAPYGYDKAWIIEGKRKCPTLVINEEEANVVRMIFDLYVNKNMGRINICHHLDQLGIKPRKGDHWASATIRDMLANVHYTGRVRWNWRQTITVVEDSEIIKMRPRQAIGGYLIYEGKHEAIISEELFNAAQEKDGKNPKVKPSKKLINPLAGLLYCQCGRAMIYREYKRPDGTVKNAPRLLCMDQVHCHTASCEYDAIIKAVCDDLRAAIFNFEVCIKNADTDSAKLHAAHIKTLEKKMRDLEAKELAQWEAQSDPDPSNRMPQEIFKRLNEKLLKEKAEAEEALCVARNSTPPAINYAEKLIKFQEALDALLDPNADPQEQNRLLCACIERIDYTREKPERIASQKIRYTENGIRKSTSPLNTGANWSDTPIGIDVKLKV